MNKNILNFMLILILVAGIGLACNLKTGDTKIADDSRTEVSETEALPKKLDAYEIKGFKFAYYLIPAGLERADLLKTAGEIHRTEPDTQLVLVDDETRVADYIKYVKSVSGAAEAGAEMPQEWAEKHIVANVQKYMNGRWVLCESYGYKEIGDIE
jgi:hypothetical protein